MAAILLYYLSAALCTYKGDVSDSAIFFIFGGLFFLVDWYIGRPSYISL